MGDLNVLVVEDNKSALDMMMMVLKKIGIKNIYTEEDGKSAYDFICHNPDIIELIVCDWSMPRMTGIELLKSVRVLYADMPFMMVTGKSDIESFMEAKELEVTSYVSKPYTPEQFVFKFNELLNNI